MPPFCGNVNFRSCCERSCPGEAPAQAAIFHSFPLKISTAIVAGFNAFEATTFVPSKSFGCLAAGGDAVIPNTVPGPLRVGAERCKWVQVPRDLPGASFTALATSCTFPAGKQKPARATLHAGFRGVWWRFTDSKEALQATPILALRKLSKRKNWFYLTFYPVGS